jgi:hypothetical protein
MEKNGNVWGEGVIKRKGKKVIGRSRFRMKDSLLWSLFCIKNLSRNLPDPVIPFVSITDFEGRTLFPVQVS